MLYRRLKRLCTIKTLKLFTLVTLLASSVTSRLLWKVSIFGIRHSISTAEIGLLVLLVLAPLFLNKRGLRKIWENYRSLLLLASILMVSAIVSSVLGPLPFRALKITLRYASFFLVFVLSLFVFEDSSDKRLAITFLKWVVILTSLLSALAILEVSFSNLDKILSQLFRNGIVFYNSGFPLASATFFNPNLFGWFAGLGALLVIFLFEKEEMSSPFFLSVLGLTVIALALSNSRNTWLFFAISLVVYLFQEKDIKAFGISVLCGILLVAPVFFTTGLVSQLPFPSAQAPSPSAQAPSPSAQAPSPSKSWRSMSNLQKRVLLWKDSLNMWGARKVFGVGPGNFKLLSPDHLPEQYQGKMDYFSSVSERYYTHNIFLSFLAEQGIIGLVVFVLLLFVIFYKVSFRSFALPILIFCLGVNLLDYYLPFYSFSLSMFMIPALLLAESAIFQIDDNPTEVSGCDNSSI